LKITNLVLTFLITGFLVGDAYGEEEVYYCAETDSNGFGFDKNLNKYKPKLFTQERFKIKFDRTAKTIEMKGHNNSVANKTYSCTAPYHRNRPELLSCWVDLFHFNFDSNNGRFVLGMISGYVIGDGDSIAVSFGKCDKF
jgi:hypothetical protein